MDENLTSSPNNGNTLVGGSFVKVKALITDKGDLSVGIFSRYWEVECPFYRDADDEEKEWFRKSIANVYGEFAEGRITVKFDYELQYKDF